MVRRCRCHVDPSFCVLADVDWQARFGEQGDRDWTEVFRVDDLSDEEEEPTPQKRSPADNALNISPLPLSPAIKNTHPSPREYSKAEIELHIRSKTPRSLRKHILSRTLEVAQDDVPKKKSIRFLSNVDVWEDYNTTKCTERPAPYRTKSILKTRTSSGGRLLGIREEQIRRYQEYMVEPITVMKYNSNGTCADRVFRLSEDGTELLWKKQGAKSFRSKMELAAVQKVVIGPRTKRFSGYKWKEGRPWLCFSLMTDQRTLDMECYSSDDFMLLFYGLQLLVPQSYEHLSIGKIHWYRSLFKTIQVALEYKVATESVWKHLVFEARFSQHLQLLKLRQPSEKKSILERRPVKTKSLTLQID